MTESVNAKERPHPAESIAVFMLSGLILFIFGGQLIYTAYFHSKSASWEKVPAEVTRIENFPKKAKLIYQYSYDGQNLIGDRYRYFSSGSLQDKSEINTRFRIGDKIIILVDPLKPSRSVAHRYPLRFEQIATRVIVIGITLAATFFYFIQRRSRISNPCHGSIITS